MSAASHLSRWAGLRSSPAPAPVLTCDPGYSVVNSYERAGSREADHAIPVSRPPDGREGALGRGASATYTRERGAGRCRDGRGGGGGGGAANMRDWAVEETGFGVAEHKEIKNRLCSIGLSSTIETRTSPTSASTPQRKIVEIPQARRRDLRADALHQSGLLGVLQGDARAPDPQRHRHQSPTRWPRPAAPTPRGCSPRAAEKAGAPDGVIQVIDEPSLADHRRDHEVRPDRPDPRDRRHADGARRLLVGQSRRSASGRATTRLCRRDARMWRSAAKLHRRLQGLRQFHPLHQRIRRHRPCRRSPSGSLAELKRQGCHMLSDEERDRLDGAPFPDGQVQHLAHRQVGGDISRKRPASACRAARACCSRRSSASATTIR